MLCSVVLSGIKLCCAQLCNCVDLWKLEKFAHGKSEGEEDKKCAANGIKKKNKRTRSATSLIETKRVYGFLLTYKD